MLRRGKTLQMQFNPIMTMTTLPSFLVQSYKIILDYLQKILKI